MKRALSMTICAAAALLAAGSAAAAVPEKWFEVEQAVNTRSSFMIRVDVDRPDRTYQEGQQMTVQLKAEKDCYVYLLYFSANGQVGCLFPNQYQKDNHVKADTVVSVPGQGAPFKFTARPPFGTEVLCVVGTLQPLGALQERGLTQGTVTLLERKHLKDMVDQLKDAKPNDWAEARIQIQTVARPGPAPQPGPDNTVQPAPRKYRRYAVCIGINDFADENIRDLKCGRPDAERMAEELRRSGQVDDVVLLLDGQASRAACEKAIFYDLPRKTRPGDEVLIYWSGHGGRLRDNAGTMHEYLVPQDAVSGQPHTMVLEEVFARWIRELDGRLVGIVLDACFSGGVVKEAKGMDGPAVPANQKGMLFFGQFKRIKDLGQAGVEALAASTQEQVAWEMPTAAEGSVLTHYVLEALGKPETDLNGDRHVSVGEVYQYVKAPVADYVRRRYNAQQNPVLIDFANDAILLKP